MICIYFRLLFISDILLLILVVADDDDDVWDDDDDDDDDDVTNDVRDWLKWWGWGIKGCMD